MTTRQRNLLFFLAIAVVASVGFFLARPRATARASGALGAVPRDAYVVVTVDVEALAASPLAKPLAGTVGKALGIGALVDTCGFDPIGRVKELAVARPDDDSDDFGVAAMIDLKEAELTACAQKVIVARGGKPKLGKHGAFTLIEDAGAESTAKAAPKLAVREGGLLLVGRGAWLDAMMEVAAGNAPGIAENKAHREVRDALEKDRRAPATITLTAVLPKALRERLKREMGAEASDGGGANANAAMAGVLGVQTAGVAISTGAAETDAAAELRCETAEACEEVKKLIERKRLGLSKDLGARLIGLGALIDSLTVTVRGAALSATMRSPTDQLAGAIDYFLGKRGAPPKEPGTAP